MLELEVDGVLVSPESIHLYAVRFVKAAAGHPELSLYRNGLRIAKKWKLKADVEVNESSCTAPG